MTMKKKIIKNKGILFWITGLSGSGKTTLSKKIFKNVVKSYGPTLLISGDDLREIFSFDKFNGKERKINNNKNKNEKRIKNRVIKNCARMIPCTILD